MTYKYIIYDYGYSNSVFPWKSAFHGKIINAQLHSSIQNSCVTPIDNKLHGNTSCVGMATLAKQQIVSTKCRVGHSGLP